jgi:hypothetical protein
LERSRLSAGKGLAGAVIGVRSQERRPSMILKVLLVGLLPVLLAWESGFAGAELMEAPCRQVCSCKMAAASQTNSGVEPGLFVPGCGACVSVFSEVFGAKAGICTGTACGIKGECGGALRVTVTSSAMACCAAALGGFSPSWGSGWVAAGSSAEHTFDAVKVPCGDVSLPIEWQLRWRDRNGTITTQSIISRLACSNCDGPAPSGS